jgi:hypothetical protein
VGISATTTLEKGGIERIYFMMAIDEVLMEVRNLATLDSI